MRKILDYITILFLFIIYAYIMNISSIPNQVVLFGNEKLNIKTLWGIETIETSSVSNNNINKTNVEVKLFGLMGIKDIAVTTLENYEVVPVRKDNRVKIIYKWSINCGNV